MTTQERKFKYPNYFLTKYQSEVYRQLKAYMANNNLTQAEVAEKLNVSTSYVNQILNGNFNFTLKTLIEIGLLVGKVPDLEFVDFEDYIQKENLRKVFKLSFNVTNRQIVRIGTENCLAENIQIKPGDISIRRFGQQGTTYAQQRTTYSYVQQAAVTYHKAVGAKDSKKLAEEIVSMY